MNFIRAFIAIDLSNEICQKLSMVLNDLQEVMGKLPVRWMPVKNIHLTIKFLGDVSSGDLDIIKELLLSETSRHSAFELQIGELGTFPSNRRPRVIWVGVEAPSEMKALYHGIETETARLGYVPEGRPFSPHLTLGRVSRNASSGELSRIGEVVSSYKVGFLGITLVDSVHLYRSDLKPSGAIYTRLFSASMLNIAP
jgi:2'-5' RNA ligase